MQKSLKLKTWAIFAKNVFVAPCLRTAFPQGAAISVAPQQVAASYKNIVAFGSLFLWKWRESNPRPKRNLYEVYVAYFIL